MMIGACGFTGTGSSAVTDYLKEFSSVSVLDKFEFSLTHGPDGLEDLDYQINEHCVKYGSSYVAIERFRSYVYNYCVKIAGSKSLKREIINITEDFIDSITLAKWKGFGAVDLQLRGFKYSKYPRINMLPYRLMHKFFSAFSSLLKKQLSSYSLHTMEFSMSVENFDNLAKMFVTNILIAFGVDVSKTIVLDQPFNPINPYRSYAYFENPVAIIVDRDPRDVFLSSAKYARTRGRGYQTPDSPEEFVVLYDRMRKALKKNLEKYERKNVLLIRFEDMVYKYDETSTIINKFCGLNNSDRIKTIFDPSLSIANTQLFRRHPEESRNIQFIEDHLSEYLYDFSDYPNADFSGKVFLNKSPLNN